MADQDVVTPVPGTFYRRPDPESEPFKNEGDSVEAGDTIALVEIMKNFQEVKAEDSGTLSEFLVANEDTVDAGQAIARLDSGG
jgi:acetyl-CoA carboxylase biotin carboxyl carrier protein